MGGGECLKNLKTKGVEQKRGEGTQRFKKEGCKGWICQHPSHPTFMVLGMLCAASKQHQPTMIKTILAADEQ